MEGLPVYLHLFILIQSEMGESNVWSSINLLP